MSAKYRSYFHQNCYVQRETKIRIGYVLKSADVGTLFSGRNSENSSHTYMRTPVQIYAHPRTITHTCAHLHTFAYSLPHPQPPTEHPCIPAHTRAHLCTPANTRTHLRTPPGHTCAHPHTPAHIPHIPTDAADTLNLINQMNKNVNRKMAERKRDR